MGTMILLFDTFFSCGQLMRMATLIAENANLSNVTLGFGVNPSEFKRERASS